MATRPASRPDSADRRCTTANGAVRAVTFADGPSATCGALGGGKRSGTRKTRRNHACVLASMGETDARGARKDGLDAFLEQQDGYTIETRTDTHAIVARRPKGLNA
jgi:hypothetical protein